MFLGSLVVAGQLSKQDTMQKITALVLLSDVLFKIVATIGTELIDYLLHVRVERAVRGLPRQDDVGATVIGRPGTPLEMMSVD